MRGSGRWRHFGRGSGALDLDLLSLEQLVFPVCIGAGKEEFNSTQALECQRGVKSIQPSVSSMPNRPIVHPAAGADHRGVE